MGYEATGQGSTGSGTAAVSQFLADQGIPAEGVVINDGSGLAESNRITCQALVELLGASGPDSELADSLAIAGRRGSLAGRFTETPAAGQVWAKTGTLRGVKALSGFVRSTAEEGGGLAFAYIVNGEVVDDSPLVIQETLVSELVTYPAGPPIGEISPLPAVPAN